MTARKPATPKPAEKKPAGCNVPRCPGKPEYRGLCARCRATHRGFIGPKEKKP